MFERVVTYDLINNLDGLLRNASLYMCHVYMVVNPSIFYLCFVVSSKVGICIHLYPSNNFFVTFSIYIVPIIKRFI